MTSTKKDTLLLLVFWGNNYIKTTEIFFFNPSAGLSLENQNQQWLEARSYFSLGIIHKKAETIHAGTTDIAQQAGEHREAVC